MDQWVLNRCNFAQEHLSMSGDTLGCHNWVLGVAASILWVKVKDTADYLIMNRTALTTKKACQ